MASVKKVKKSAKRSKKPAPSAEQRRFEDMSPEEMLENLPEIRSEHRREVRDLGNRMVDLIKESGYHPSVAMDAAQVMLTTGIGLLLGRAHQDLWQSHVAKFHEESKLLSILEMLGGPEGVRDLFQAQQDTTEEPPTPEK